MSEDQRQGMTEDGQDEVEGHRHSKLQAHDEPADEVVKGARKETDEDEVEAHRHSKLNAPKKF
jgi:hypothetical protein